METKRDSFFMKSNKQKPDKKKTDDYKGKQERQKSFDANRNGVQEKKDEKKPFDKKAYRLKKYSKKYKLEQWEEQRKKRMMHEYQKTLKNEQVTGTYKPKSFDEDEPDGNSEVGKFVRHPDFMRDELQSKKEKKDPFSKAKEQFNKIKQDKIDKKQALERAKQERMQKLQEYKKKKQERFKKLSKKTKKGQPVMTGRMELLLEKIQQSK